MERKKKIGFYNHLTSGHVNVSAAVASTILNNYFDEIEVYFFVDQLWAEKLSKIDSRFRFEIFENENKNEDEMKKKNPDLSAFIKIIEPLLSLPEVEKLKSMLNLLNNSDNMSSDEKISKLIKKVKPDYLLCDLVYHMPSLVESKIPYSFIISCNPLILNIEDFPIIGIGDKIFDKEKIKTSKLEMKETYDKISKKFKLFYEKYNIKLDEKFHVYSPRSNHLTFYNYPKELDYFDDNIRNDYKLLQIDSPIVPSRVPAPYSLPEEFSKLPGKIIYVSLGSMFSCYHTKLQKLLDTLATLPYKYIVSKGPNGDKIKFPDNRFIGENFINQLAVLQVVDMMIAHGGNNTFTECFHFGVPALIFPMIGDQINNAVRIEETGFGYKMDLMNYTQEELSDKINKVLSNETLIEKIKKVGERIRQEKSLEKSVKKFYEYLKSI